MKSNQAVIRLPSVVAALCCLIAPGLSRAAPVPADAADAPGEALEEIVVTAQRRTEDVQKAAISVAVVTGDTLQKQAKNSVDQVLRDVPAVDIQGSPQGGQIYIRGVGNNGDNDIVDSDVALMFDGVYSGRAEAVLASSYDIQRVEVLRGPQGTLYGRNATGGVINILSNDPGKELSAGFNGDAGNYDLRHADAYLNVPIGDQLSARLAVLRDKHTGYYSDGGGANDVKGARFKLLYTPMDDLTLLAAFDYWHSYGPGQTSVLEPGLNPSSNKWDTSASLPFPYTVLPDQDNYTFKTYSLRAEWNLGWSVLTVLPAYVYSQRDVLTNIFAPGPYNSMPFVEEQKTVEARLASAPAAPFQWVVGTYILRDDNAAPLSSQGLTGIYFLRLPNNYPVQSDAVFGQLTYPLTADFRLTGGIRYNRDKKSQSYGICTTTDTTTCNGLYTSPETTYSGQYSAVTWKTGVEYDLAAQSMAYAQVATGYKAGGIVEASPPSVYQPEKLTAFELGSKSRFFEGRVQLNAEAYYYLYKNYQVSGQTYLPISDIVPAAYLPAAALTATNFTGTVLNAKTGKNYGLEIESSVLATRADRVDASLALIHATYGELEQPNPPGPPGTGGPDPYVLTGREVANSPKTTFHLGYTHTFSLPVGSLDVHGQTKLSSSYYDTIFQFYGAALQKSYSRSDANITYTAPDDRWRLGVWVKNIEDKGQITNNLPFFRVMLSDPRTFGVNVSAKF